MLVVFLTFHVIFSHQSPNLKGRVKSSSHSTKDRRKEFIGRIVQGLQLPPRRAKEHMVGANHLVQRHRHTSSLQCILQEGALSIWHYVIICPSRQYPWTNQAAHVPGKTYLSRVPKRMAVVSLPR